MPEITRRIFLENTAVAAGGLVVPGGILSASEKTATPFPTVRDEGRLVSTSLEAYREAKLSGGPGKDGIPSIDKPDFWTAEEAQDYLEDGDKVIGLIENGHARAYPQRILVWHEIVNDAPGQVPLAITYCPLTGTSLAFERGETTFGVSGRLVNSNLIMYDRQSDTWIPQILGVATEGPHAGVALVERPLVWTTWGRWRKRHPGTQVLSTRTGFARNYTRDPYGSYTPLEGYYRPEASPIFPLMQEDERFPPKSIVLGARTATEAVAFSKERLREAGQLVLEGRETTFVAVHDEGLDTGYIFEVPRPLKESAVVEGTGPGNVRWSEDLDARALNAFEAMWFAWAAFYPDSHVHE
ncbi:DUF3179 domain-containing protein [Fodinicurvata sediminis]|uniref:DUF3179 domain-containing protein n=1 Tax=Fodinicurvata sediminis TaxID=1121832 RepID=UPI0003B78BD4|nr:DUF3179 domain-containing protein [Fodinicurvata sediminis]